MFGTTGIRIARLSLLVVATGLATASPAYAQGGIVLPEPSGIVLLGLGLAGLIIGRQASRKRHDKD